jgi:LL-diaminopimelate aminotransferase
MQIEFVNQVTSHLRPYPMEELARIRARLHQDQKTVYDFGTGDPQIPTWAPIRKELLDSVPDISQYPSIRGTLKLGEAQQGYLKRRFAIEPSDKISVLPTRGSKEAVFHIALSLCGRNGKNTLIFPNPGYPVYQSSAQFCGATPYPVKLRESNGFLLEPWKLPKEVQTDAFAIWLNYPHNPTGATACRSYWQKVIDWCHENNCILLSDDCYIDIFHPSTHPDDLPLNPLQLSTDRVISMMSLSKRSGLTGYRSGFIAGDSRILEPHARARANFGLGLPEFVQNASVVAWNDDTHVAERREIFAERLDYAGAVLKELGLIDTIPNTTFYLWCRVPKAFDGDDIKFCLELAERGVITVPSSWLSDGVKGYFRLAMVPDLAKTEQAMAVLKTFINQHS